MNPAFSFLLTATAISLLSMVDPALADPVGDSAEAADRVILEAGEIDSSTVPAGSYVVVIHGQGERHPVSDEWEQLVTSRGYVHAVDARVLTLFRGWDGEPDWIEVDRIQTLVMAGSPFQKRAEGGSANTEGANFPVTVPAVAPKSQAADSNLIDPGEPVPGQTGMRDTVSTRTDALRARRVALKLLGGTVGGIFSVLVVVLPNFDLEGQSSPEVIWPIVVQLVWVPMSISAGVSVVDRHDRFVYPLAASMLVSVSGVASGGGLPLWILVPSATIASEWSRKPLDSSRFSVSLMPHPERGLSAVARLRF